MNELQQIDPDECLRLVATNRIGRLAVSLPGRPPMIRLINYLFDEPSHSVVFRTGDGPKLSMLLATRQAAFEIDGLNMKDRTGWSVVVRGVAQEVTDPLEIRRLTRAPLDVWAPGNKPHWMRIRARTITGRRISAPEALDKASVVFRNSTAARPG